MKSRPLIKRTDINPALGYKNGQKFINIKGQIRVLKIDGTICWLEKADGEQYERGTCKNMKEYIEGCNLKPIV